MMALFFCPHRPSSAVASRTVALEFRDVADADASAAKSPLKTATTFFSNRQFSMNEKM